MRYKVGARCWDGCFSNSQSLIARFGARDQMHELSDTEVIDLIIEFGRATITPMCNDGSDGPENYRTLVFENDYD